MNSNKNLKNELESVWEAYLYMVNFLRNHQNLKAQQEIMRLTFNFICFEHSNLLRKIAFYGLERLFFTDDESDYMQITKKLFQMKKNDLKHWKVYFNVLLGLDENQVNYN